MKKLKVRDTLTPKEKETFIEILFTREKALAFDFIYQEKVYLEVSLL